MNSHFRPVGGRILTGTFLVSAAIFLVSVLILIWRFIVGLGPTTAMNSPRLRSSFSRWMGSTELAYNSPSGPSATRKMFSVLPG